VARVYGRQTERASEIVRLIGYVSGGLPGQRLLARLSVATSDDTVLRRVRQKPSPEPSVLPIRNLGVDDWAWLRNDPGQSGFAPRRGSPPDEAAESFSAWLQKHPKSSRFRGISAFYAGAALGAPPLQATESESPPMFRQ